MPDLTAKQHEWASHVKAWLDSGLERRDYAEREALDAQRLGWWRWKLGTMGVRFDEEEISFVEVEVEEPPQAEVPIEVFFADGVMVRVATGFDAATFSRVVEVLRGVSP